MWERRSRLCVMHLVWSYTSPGWVSRSTRRQAALTHLTKLSFFTIRQMDFLKILEVRKCRSMRAMSLTAIDEAGRKDTCLRGGFQSLSGLSLHLTSHARGEEEKEPFITTQRQQRKTLAGSGLREQFQSECCLGTSSGLINLKRVNLNKGDWGAQVHHWGCALA